MIDNIIKTLVIFIYFKVKKLFTLLNRFALISSILFFFTRSLSNPIWDVWEEFSSSNISAFFCPWVLDIFFISFLQDSNKSWNFLFSKDNFINISGKCKISSLSYSNNSNKGLIASAFSFLYFIAFGSSSPMLFSSLCPSWSLLSIHLTIYEISFLPYLLLSKVKLNLYSVEVESLLQKSIKSSNSLNCSSLNKVWYWFIRSI